MLQVADSFPEQLIVQIKSLIDSSRQIVASTINSTMTLLYWNIGKTINSSILNDTRAEYGKFIYRHIAEELHNAYGGGAFSEKHLRQMTRFAAIFPDEKIVYTLCRQLSWSHLRLLLSLNDQIKREFYITMCADQKWSVRTLKSKLDGMLYERTVIAKQPEEVILHELKELRMERKMSASLVFQDPYILDFLGLNGNFSERELEDAIVSDLQHFISELGNDFAFLARQKRITVDDESYYIDLLFFHRRLRSLVAIDLKLGRFKAEYKGQMELYLRWLEKYEMVEGENKPIGLILCAGKNEEHVELMHLHENNIRVADYLTKLPSQEWLEEKLQQSIINAKNRLINNES